MLNLRYSLHRWRTIENGLQAAMKRTDFAFVFSFSSEQQHDLCRSWSHLGRKQTFCILVFTCPMF